MGSDDDEAPPPNLVVDAKAAPGDASDGSGTAMLPFALPVVVGGALAKFVAPLAGLVGLVAAIVVAVLLRKPDDGKFVLHVQDGMLEVRREKLKEPLQRVALADIFHVTLDRETRQGGRGGGATERVRLAFERKEAEPFFVPEDRITPLEAQEWQSKVRVFLRKHGWTPKDERGASE